MPRARLFVYDVMRDASRRELESSLAEAGVALDARVPPDPHVATIVCFSIGGPSLLGLLRNESIEGTRRVLAVALSPLSLPQDAWALIASGASDVICWRDGPTSARAVKDRLDRWETVDAVITEGFVRENLVGKSAVWMATVRQIAEVALFTDAPLLLSGETGTGKELVARLVHTLDGRARKRELILVDCTTLVPELAGSELFGHERGAFTGAVSTRDGACSLADGGTLFLDEIGELPLALQSELLRVVQEGTYKPVGSNRWRHAKFRLIGATNRDLKADVARGRFRRDLYYRIAAVVCTLPPLRDRMDDIMPLVEHFIERGRPDMAAAGIRIDAAVREYLIRREYPGNVRDLRHLVARMLYRHPGSGSITVGDVPEDERPDVESATHDWRDAAFVHAIGRALAQGARLRDIARAATDAAIRIALRDEGSVRAAARRLGVTDRALQLRRASARRQEELESDGELEQKSLGDGTSGPGEADDGEMIERTD